MVMGAGGLLFLIAIISRRLVATAPRALPVTWVTVAERAPACQNDDVQVDEDVAGLATLCKYQDVPLTRTSLAWPEVGRTPKFG